MRTKAVTLAERLDRQRGNVMPDNARLADCEPRGTDYAESVALLALRLQREVFGVTTERE